MAAELAHNAVPSDAAANVGSDVYANAVGPTDKNPNAVVDTTSAERRALDNSAKLEMVDDDVGCDAGDVGVVIDVSCLLFCVAASSCNSAVIAAVDLLNNSLLLSSSLLFDELVVVEENVAMLWSPVDNKIDIIEEGWPLF